MGAIRAELKFSRWEANSYLSFLTTKAKRATWPAMRPTVFGRQRHVIFTEAALDFFFFFLKDKDDIETICFRLCAIW